VAPSTTCCDQNGTSNGSEIMQSSRVQAGQGATSRSVASFSQSISRARHVRRPTPIMRRQAEKKENHYEDSNRCINVKSMQLMRMVNIGQIVNHTGPTHHMSSFPNRMVTRRVFFTYLQEITGTDFLRQVSHLLLFISRCTLVISLYR
jgi:hypothetical protein